MGYVTRAYFTDEGTSSDHYTDGKHAAMGTVTDLLAMHELGHLASLASIEILVGVEPEDFEMGDYAKPHSQ